MAAQDAAVRSYHIKVWDFANAFGSTAYIGTDYMGVTITESGLLGASHLVGAYDLAYAIKSGTHVYDGNGVSASSYMTLFSGYDVSLITKRRSP